MKQSTTIPQTTMDRVVERLDFNIADPNAVHCNSEIILEDPISKERSILKRTDVNVNILLAKAITDGHLTAANLTGFKKAIRAICAEVLELAYTNTNDPLA